mmetsp:Transcript_75334/g.200319  ORF Transcript_75334/g.200319 Transcript_75334/m.200319 type:complete len:103 (-) Transcript_75334:103-411(-)
MHQRESGCARTAREQKEGEWQRQEEVKRRGREEGTKGFSHASSLGRLISLTVHTWGEARVMVWCLSGSMDTAVAALANEAPPLCALSALSGRRWRLWLCSSS